MGISFSFLFFSFILTMITVPIIIKIAIKLNIVDKPNLRKVHKISKPLLGGVAIAFGFIVTTVTLNYFFNFNLLDKPEIKAMLIGGTLMLILGLIDDIRPISAIVKLIFQILIICYSIHLGIKIDFLTNILKSNGILYTGMLKYPITLIWMLAIVNTVNLSDGLDGLSSGITCISSLTLIIVSYLVFGTIDYKTYLLIAIFGSSLAFLFFNFNPSKIFMGDAGSLFLGFIIGAMSIITFSKGAILVSLIVPITTLGLPIFDTVFAIIRRKKNSKPIFSADKNHFHHELLNMGLTHAQTVFIIYLISIILSSVAIALTSISDSKAILIMLFLSVILYSGIKKIKFCIANKEKINFSALNKNFFILSIFSLISISGVVYFISENRTQNEFLFFLIFILFVLYLVIKKINIKLVNNTKKDEK